MLLVQSCLFFIIPPTPPLLTTGTVCIIGAAFKMACWQGGLTGHGVLLADASVTGAVLLTAPVSLIAAVPILACWQGGRWGGRAA